MTVRADGYVQDRASQLVAAHVGARPGERVLDVCAAPGGKATAMARRPGPPWSSPPTCPAGRAARSSPPTPPGSDAGDVAVVVADGCARRCAPGASTGSWSTPPARASGVLRRRPDARWRMQPGDVARLAGLQRRLLTAAAAAGPAREACWSTACAP